MKIKEKTIAITVWLTALALLFGAFVYFATKKQKLENNNPEKLIELRFI